MKSQNVEALIVAPDTESLAAIVTAAQRAELRVRLAHHRAHRDEAGVTVQELTAKLIAPAP